MRSTKTRLSAVFVTLLLTVGIVAPAAADHSPLHTAAQAELASAQQDLDQAQAELDTAEAALQVARQADQAREDYEAALARESEDCSFSGKSPEKEQECDDATAAREAAEAALTPELEGQDVDALQAAVDAATVTRDEAEEDRDAAQLAVDEATSVQEDADTATPQVVSKVDICHATASGSNPFNAKSVSVRSIINIPNGHEHHDGDVIPPFHYGDPSDPSYFAGLNWDAAGQELWNDACGEDDFVPATPTVTLEAGEICEDEENGIQIHLDNPTDGAVTFSGALSQDDSDLASGSHTVTADSEYLFEATAPAAGAYEIEWEARDGDDELLAGDSFSITVDPCSDPDPQTYPVLPIKGWFFEGLDTDEVPTGYATVEVSYDDGDELSGSEQYRVEIGEPLLPVTDGPGELGDGVLSISLPYDGDAVAAPLDVPTTIDLGDVTITEVDYEVAGFECTASYPDPGEVPPGQVQTLSELDGPVVPFPWLLEIGEDVQLLPVLNTCVADTETGGSGGNGNNEDDDVPVGNPTVYELDVDAQEVCLPDDLREVIVLELDGRNVTSADIELQDADGNTLDTVTNLNLNASPHQLDWPVDDDGQLYAEVTVVVTSPQRVQLDIEPIVVNLADEALADCTEVGGIVDENPEPQPEPEPQPQPEPQPGPEPQPQPVVDDEVEVRDVVIEREVPVARGQLPRTGATTVALVMTGLLSLLTGGALLRSGRREEDAS